MPSTGPEQGRLSDTYLHVAAAVVENSKGEILIARRPEHLHQGGLWEFPGGKLEAGEDVLSALTRELAEEVNLDVNTAQPLMQIPWHYGDKAVMLDVWRVQDYSGEARGLEGQLVKWVNKTDLGRYDFPAANQGILHALRLPEAYLITGKFNDLADFMARLTRQLEKGIRLVQLRAKHLSDEALEEYVIQARALCEQYHAELLLNADTALAKRHGLGLHLNSRCLLTCDKRPLAKGRLLAASVHNERELRHAVRIGVDFMVISPVQSTASHPESIPMGWDRFRQLASQSPVPVYALGGMSQADIEQARTNGAQGIAAISCFWNEDEKTGTD